MIILWISKLLLQSACTSMCRHIYDWNIFNCDVKQPFQQQQQQIEFRRKSLNYEKKTVRFKDLSLNFKEVQCQERK